MATQDRLLGRTLAGRYQVLRRLGAGGLGTVYVARQLAVGRDVAVKVLHDAIADSPEHRQRFEREAKALAQLRHPNVIGILDVGSDEGTSFLVMELFEGRPLGDVLAEGGVPTVIALELVRQLLRALAYAHGLRIIHRDLKPANILVRRLPDGSPHLVVLDFGIAKFLDDEGGPSSLTKQGAILGTPAYMAPEQATGGVARPMLDVYAAGLVAFELLVGRRPFPETDRAELLRAHLMVAPPLPSSLRPELATIPGLDAFLLKALEKKPANRFADGIQMLEAFERIAPPLAMTPSSPGVVAVAPPPAMPVAVERPPSVAGMPGGRLLVILLAVGVTAALVLGLAVMLFLRSEPEAAPAPAPRAVQAPIAPTASAPPPGPSPLSGEPPAEIASLQRTILNGGRPSRDGLQPLYRYNAAHPEDARGELLLGRTYTDRRWFSDATTAYAEACRRDRASASDPRLRADLIRISAGPRFGDAAGRVVATCLGRSAVTEVEAAAAAQTDAASRERLEALASQLRQSP
ncbi:MAG: serine/threonine-protein kinase [Polyangiales bacterium]